MSSPATIARGSRGLTMHGSLLTQSTRNTAVETARTVALDDMFPYEGRWADLVKLDLEGGEPRALSGMGRVLSRARSLIMEVNPERLAMQRLDAESLIALAVELGGFDCVEGLPNSAGALGNAARKGEAAWTEQIGPDLNALGWSSVLLSRSGPRASGA